MKFIDKLIVIFLIVILLITILSSMPQFIKVVISVFLIILTLSILLGRDRVKRKTSFTFDEVAQIFGGECERCGAKKNLHKHHRIPLYKGGTNEISNFIVLCDECHKREHRRR